MSLTGDPLRDRLQIARDTEHKMWFKKKKWSDGKSSIRLVSRKFEQEMALFVLKLIFNANYKEIISLV